MRRVLALSVLSSLCFQCAAPNAPSGELGSPLITAGTADEVAVLALVNDPSITQETLDIDARLDRRAATGIIAHRAGADGIEGTADDVAFSSAAELDAIPYVGNAALSNLLAYAQAQGYGGSAPPPANGRDAVILSVVNDTTVGFDVLDDDVGLDRRAAGNIVEHRSGNDGLLDTADDRLFQTVNELDAIPYVGPSALDALFAFGSRENDLPPSGAMADVVFSPQPFANSHANRIETLIDGADDSLDIAIYSFSIGSLYTAIERAVDRGVRVRLIFETANGDRSKTGDAFESSRSARLERMGVQVRYVNKIMHHKFVIVDGPRDDAAHAETATVATGSANWSSGGATRYDENTLFLRGYPELSLRFQREFDHLWAHSRDFVYDESLPYTLSTYAPSEIVDAANVDVLFTSDNFNVYETSPTTFRVTGANTVSDALVEAIGRARASIHIMSGHLRSRPVAEAIMAQQQAHPELDVRVYLDGQEYVSAYAHRLQLSDLEDCLSAAGESASATRRCNERGFKFGHALTLSGVDVRYKFYAYRWHYSYAPQMHNKVLIIDGEELWTGSYNLSDNAEHNTFENMLVFRGAEFAPLVEAFEARFEQLWQTNRDDGSYAATMDSVENDTVIPLVFTPVAMTPPEVDALRAAIRANCADLFTPAFRSSPESHTVCYR